MRKKGGVVLCCLLWAVAYGATSVSQWDVTFTFTEDKTTGTFANGDYWVVGPVVISSITPDVITDGTGLHHGWEVNPGIVGPQGFEERIGDFDAGLVPDLPYTAQPGQSIVKSISIEPLDNAGCRPCLRTAAVLTVVDAVPPGNGADVFRPPYVVDEKPYYYIDSLRTDLLPSYAPVPVMPTLESQYESFRRVQMDHQPGRTSTYLRPADALPFYAANINQEIGDAMLRLMMDDPVQDKMDLLTVFVQCGIDYFHFTRNGQYWPAGGGEQPGNIMPMVFAATMLGDDAMKDEIRGFIAADNGFPYADRTVRRNVNGTVVWGHWDIIKENVYWDKLEYYNAPGSKTIADPYNYIDGGYHPGGGYQGCCTSQPFKSSMTAMLLMPEMRQIWNPVEVIEYVDRWVSLGTWTQPDPCAPYDSNGTEGVDFGPDPDNPGDCIRDTDPSDGIGRFPELHGTETDGGLRKSTFVAFMYNMYRFTGIDENGSGTLPQLSMKTEGAGVTVNLPDGRYGIHGKRLSDGESPYNGVVLTIKDGRMFKSVTVR